MSKSSKNKNNNEIVIKKDEIDDFVNCFSANKIGEIFYLMQEECRLNALPILDNTSHNTYSNFINLILECVNSNEVYKDNNNLDV